MTFFYIINVLFSLYVPLITCHFLPSSHLYHVKKAERKGQLSVLFHYVPKLHSCKDETFQKIEHKLKLILKASKILNGGLGHTFSFSIMVLKIIFLWGSQLYLDFLLALK